MINLKEIITKYPDCLSGGSKLKGILADLYPQEKLYAGILADMLSDGIVAEIKGRKELDSLTFKNLCERVENNRGLAHKHVEGCLNIWANAFNIKITTPPAPPKLTPVQKTHRQTGEIGELHGHKYTKTVIPPTCTEKGYTLHTCDCGYEYKDNFVNAKHNYILVEYVEPTCEKEGRETYKCSICGEEKVEILPATGHKFGKWIEQTKPTCTENGTEVRQCSNCGKKETQPIKATEHKFSAWRIEGNLKIRDCKNCGATETIDIIQEQEEIEKERAAEKQRKLDDAKKELRKHIIVGTILTVLFSVPLTVLGIWACVSSKTPDDGDFFPALCGIGVAVFTIWVWVVFIKDDKEKIEKIKRDK